MGKKDPSLRSGRALNFERLFLAQLIAKTNSITAAISSEQESLPKKRFSNRPA